MSIAVIGCGNLGTSLANGLLRAMSYKTMLARRIYLTKSSDLTKLNKSFGKYTNVTITNDNDFAIRNSEHIFVCVEPRHVNVFHTFPEYNNKYDGDKMIISCLSGYSIDHIKNMLPLNYKVCRAMPNTATSINQGLIFTTNLDKKSENILKYLGHIEEINEDLMSSATVMGACGIAFAMKYVRAATQGGVEVGFNAETSRRIVQKTVLGAAALLEESHPEIEIDKVTTPNGCTITGLNEMEHHGFSSSVIKGIVKSRKLLK